METRDRQTDRHRWEATLSVTSIMIVLHIRTARDAMWLCCCPRDFHSVSSTNYMLWMASTGR